MESAEQIGKTLIVQAGSHASDLGRLDLNIQNGKIASHEHTLTLLDHSEIPPDQSTDYLVSELLRQLVPHEGKLVTMRLSGAQILDVLEQAVTNVFTIDPKIKVGGMIQISGIRFQYDPERADGQRVVNVEPSDGKWDLNHL